LREKSSLIQSIYIRLYMLRIHSYLL